MTIYEKNGKYGIKIEQVVSDGFEVSNILEREESVCSLFWKEQNKNLQLAFYSNIKEIQALEFMDYLVHNYTIVQGNAYEAKAMLDGVFLQTMLMEYEENSIEQLL